MSDQGAHSPWLNAAELAALLRLPSRKAARVWAAREGLVAVRRGRHSRQLLYALADVRAALIPVVPRERGA